MKCYFQSILALVCLTLLTIPGELHAGNKPGSVLVSTDWLSARIGNKNLTVLYIGSKDEFERKHIPGSRIVSMREMIVQKDSLNHEMPEKEFATTKLKGLGINNDSEILISFSDERMVPIVARLYVLLDYFGLGKQTHILNGGYKAWEEIGGKFTSDSTLTVKGNYNVSMKTEVLISGEIVLKNLDNSEYTIIDARPEEAYEGREEESKWARQGHIPGSINIPLFNFTYEDKPAFFKTDSEMKKIFDESFVNKDSELVTYCGTGIWASVVYVAAKQLGYKVRFYDGSFEEWSKNKKYPVVEPLDAGMKN